MAQTAGGETADGSVWRGRTETMGLADLFGVASGEPCKPQQLIAAKLVHGGGKGKRARRPRSCKTVAKQCFAKDLISGGRAPCH
jgi:hypothetical protein